MKVILVGYGKMGKEIEHILLERGHTVISKIDSKTTLNQQAVKEADVAIEFSTPQTVLENIQFLIEHKIPTVVGTTGWNSNYEEVKKLVQKEKGALLSASNFSIGVNLFFELNKKLANLMAKYKEYTPKITEIHHTEKLDAPSGTAISLANDLIADNLNYTDWFCPQSEEHNTKKETSLEIEAVRKKDVKGTHTVEYISTIDKISIHHEAFNRKGFALGAVIAAEWIQNKTGVFTMKDVLQLS